jgi:putative Ca2+/H+ antiporter (TMEM165/GDT1 family)
MRNCALHELRNQYFDRAVKLEGARMDWRVLLTTFGVIFLAEMGDKTQLAAMTMAAEKKRPWEVFVGASLALAAVSAVGIVVGTALGHYLPLDWIKRVAGAAFVVIGLLILIGKF